MKNIAVGSRVKVSADGYGVVSHAGMAMVRELADRSGLSAQVTAALADTYRGPWVYAPGEVFADLAAAVADGADCIDAVGQLCGDREHVLGAKASTTTMWRLIDERIDASHLPRVRAARAAARAALGRRRRPAPGGWLHIDIDATLVLDHSDNKEKAGRPGKTYGHHPLLAFVDRPEIAGGEALAAYCAPVARAPTPQLTTSVSSAGTGGLPARWRPDPDHRDDPDKPAVLVRCDTAGATHDFADACRAAAWGSPSATRGLAGAGRCGHSQHRAVLVSGDRHRRWYPRGRLGRRGHQPGQPVIVAAGTRLILRKERPHPGAQLRFTDADGMRVTAFITDTPPGVVAGQVAGLELRHRQHARVEDRIRELKATGLRNLPCQAFDANAAWLEIVLAAADLVTWCQLIGFTGHPGLTRAEIATFRYRVLHVAARITRGARRTRLRIDATWRWAAAIATAWQHIRTAFG
ncbi:IS1380 family transposase [Mycobacterium bourgelatii]|uniref:IS1380 family transposase n=1 Tax=Mycobacterium bourgelatii TaxID=1273442 RepID=UPI001F076FEA|nr:IS1380 family transposase [Mycobacterium bourgelatii]